MAKKSKIEEVVVSTKKAVESAAVETKKALDEANAAEGGNIAKEGADVGTATKSFFKEIGEFFVAIGRWLKKLFAQKKAD